MSNLFNGLSLLHSIPSLRSVVQFQEATIVSVDLVENVGHNIALVNSQRGIFVRCEVLLYDLAESTIARMVPTGGPTTQQHVIIGGARDAVDNRGRRDYHHGKVVAVQRGEGWGRRVSKESTFFGIVLLV
jgi:hypothetical protein